MFQLLSSPFYTLQEGWAPAAKATHGLNPEWGANECVQWLDYALGRTDLCFEKWVKFGRRE